MRSAIKLRRLLQTSELLYAPLYYKMPFLPYEAFHSVRGCLQRTAAPKGQMICNDCCRHLWGLPLYLLTTVTNAGCRTVTIQGTLPRVMSPPASRIKSPVLMGLLYAPFVTSFYHLFPPFSRKKSCENNKKALK